MARTVGIGHQNFEQLITNDNFYVDKTMFIKEWWENQDVVTLLTRPRRFGKTLTMSMVEQFFSIKYAGRGDLFEGLAIWEDEKYRRLQGTYPVIFLSFAVVKEMNYHSAVQRISQLLTDLYHQNDFLLESDVLSDTEKKEFSNMSVDVPEVVATMALHKLSEYLYRYYGKKVIILLDEYDTPMQEAYVNGYWNEIVSFTRSLFNAAFKTNPYMERAIMTGITRVSKESIFSDLNNLAVVTTTSAAYADCLGFTEQEVWTALEEFGLSEKRETVKRWYDGFTFGERRDIYNPWSILNFLKSGKVSAYWAPEDLGLRVADSRQMSTSGHLARCHCVNTSSNSLVGKLIREGNVSIKLVMEDLLEGKALHTKIDEQIIFDQLDQEDAIWSLLLAGGYLRVEKVVFQEETGLDEYDLVLTNKEVRVMFEKLFRKWFAKSDARYNEFVRSLLRGNLEEMNYYMNCVTEETFSTFDTGKKPSKTAEPERFYHGFVLGLLAELRGRYRLTSNRESGLGRYDVMLEPVNEEDDAIIIEFKVFRPAKEQTLEDTVKSALAQIEEKKYAASLRAKGIAPERIRKYGFAFEGKKVLIG